jgi:glycolate oxidase iron-sulfur subunit
LPKQDSPIAYILEETSKCYYCGFCEPACPTLRIVPLRSAGPRGRVNLARMLVHGVATEGLVEGLFSCLLCAACVPYCPAGLDIVGVIRKARRLIASSPGLSSLQTQGLSRRASQPA